MHWGSVIWSQLYLCLTTKVFISSSRWSQRHTNDINSCRALLYARDFQEFWWVAEYSTWPCFLLVKDQNRPVERSRQTLKDLLCVRTQKIFRFRPSSFLLLFFGLFWDVCLCVRFCPCLCGRWALKMPMKWVMYGRRMVTLMERKRQTDPWEVICSSGSQKRTQTVWQHWGFYSFKRPPSTP